MATKVAIGFCMTCRRKESPIVKPALGERIVGANDRVQYFIYGTCGQKSRKKRGKKCGGKLQRIVGKDLAMRIKKAVAAKKKKSGTRRRSRRSRR